MLITEIFYSLQGEGELMGVPSVFIRAGGCNLRCVWCDTPYSSWDPKGDKLTPKEISEEIQGYSCDYVVLTGGEPMLFPEMHDLAQTMRTQKKHITIETAATILPGGIACDLASLSPKLKNSLPLNNKKWEKRHEKTRYQVEVIRAWVDQGDYQFKFVISSPDDLEEVESILEDIQREIPPEKVFLMPEGISLDALHEKSSWLVDICRKKGYRYGHRLHIELFGNTKGT